MLYDDVFELAHVFVFVYVSIHFVYMCDILVCVLNVCTKQFVDIVVMLYQI